MPNKLVAVIIPIYKQKPDANELLSLKQCLTILKNYPIIFIAPDKLNAAAYKEACEGAPFKLVTFSDFYFDNLAGYNQLMLSPDFYKTFIDYKFILIYQLDAYVFKDELNYWCSQNYDFIGAPHIPHENQENEMQFLKGYSKFINRVNSIFKTKHKVSNVGNGGFSLRKTQTCYLLLKILKGKVKIWGPNNEDGFFKYWGNLFYPFFKLPTDELAIRFSIEESPALSLKKLNGELPFGCHAFEKYEWATWEPLIFNNNRL
ncbi:DUF5672 family protein [Mucilaginibacter sp. FT3.2]|uniref:DUF5672 family protein n=1 Tax=Mucilaginibacter sp. FT3.2 TaxID=2723090 RepID=UPI00160959F7|nr:DUF5672 family protein [Mucilaginibacter sp. FT3.2]MBB6231301.1 hypothetical protein [Mucilaginibacter sp. FT3.2]